MIYFQGLQFLEFNEIPCCSVWVDRTFSCHALNFVYTGTIEFQENEGESCFLEGPAAFWTYPGVHYRYGVVRPDSWHHFYVTFTGPRVGAFVRGGLLPEQGDGRSFRPLADPLAFRRGFQSLLGCLSRAGKGTAEPAHLLEGLLLSLHQDPGPLGVPDEIHQRIVDYAAEIENAPGETKPVPGPNGRFPYSPTHFRRLFRKVTGLAPGAFRNRARLDLAARLLRTTERPLKDIAEECGFCDVYHFSKLFKRARGRPPGEYRRIFQLRSALKAP